MTLLNLTKKLIEIPSYVDNKNNETNLGNFIYQYLKQNLPWLNVEKQIVENNRFNIIALPKGKVNMVFLSHMDTVNPIGNIKKQLTPIVKNNKLYGLGSADMKSGMATAIKVVESIGENSKTGLIFDIDEEYYFKGVTKLIKDIYISPKLIICPEPTNLRVINGCRGILEIELEIRGKSGHASRPNDGTNAIELAVDLVKQLSVKLQQLDNKEIGKSTINLAFLEGGIYTENVKQKYKIQANAIPDYARLIIDIRPAFSNTKAVSKLTKKIITNLNGTLISYKTNLNLQGYLAKRKLIEQYLPKNVLFAKDLDTFGFYEASIISNSLKIPAISFGPTGKGHIENECVDIDSIYKTEKIFQEIIRKVN